MQSCQSVRINLPKIKKLLRNFENSLVEQVSYKKKKSVKEEDLQNSNVHEKIKILFCYFMFRHLIFFE